MLSMSQECAEYIALELWCGAGDYGWWHFLVVCHCAADHHLHGAIHASPVSTHVTPCAAHGTWLTWHNGVQFSVGKTRVYQVAQWAHFLTGLQLERQAVPVTSMVQPSPLDLACTVS